MPKTPFASVAPGSFALRAAWQLAVSAPPRGFDWPTAIGKKNWLFIGDPKSGDRAAACYTLIGNCHRAGIDAQAYLTDLFTRLPLPTETTKTLGSLTPHGWAAARNAVH